MASDLPHKAGFFPREGKEKAAGLSGKLGEKQEEKKKWSFTWDWSSQLLGVDWMGVKNHETGIISKKGTCV